MVDVDGVIIVPPPGSWAAKLESDLGISRDELQRHFFQPHWQDVVLGRAELSERLGPVLADRAPHLTVQQLVDYWFRHDAVLNMPLLADLAELRQSGIALHLATLQEHQRAAHLWEGLGLKDRFDAMHYSASIGFSKVQPDFYIRVQERTGLTAGEIAFIDDTHDNVQAACAAGWRGLHWDGSTKLFDLFARAGLPIASAL